MRLYEKILSKINIRNFEDCDSHVYIFLLAAKNPKNKINIYDENKMWNLFW